MSSACKNRVLAAVCAVSLWLTGAACAGNNADLEKELAKPYSVAAIQLFLKNAGVAPFFDSMTCSVLSSTMGAVAFPPAEHPVVLSKCRLADSLAGPAAPGSDILMAGILVPERNKLYPMHLHSPGPFEEDLPKVHLAPLRKDSPDYIVLTDIEDGGNTRKDMLVSVFRPEEDEVRKVFKGRRFARDFSEGGDMESVGCGFSSEKTETSELVYGPWDKNGVRPVSIAKTIDAEAYDGSEGADGKCHKNISITTTTIGLVWNGWRLQEAEKK